MSDEIKRVPENAPDWTIPTDLGGVPTAPGVKGPGKGGPSRRTVLAGAAWTVPVIALAVATPLAAASTSELTLTFVNGPYSAVACGPLDDITIHAAQGGAPAAGALVTVTLPAGITWSDGTTGPRVMTADASGNVVLTGLKAPNQNGDFALVAQSGTATATTVVTSVGADRGVISTFGGSFLPSLPAGVLIEEMETNTTSSGVYTIIRGSDGNAYVSSLANGASTWSAWSKSVSSLAGSITNVAISNQGLTNVLASDTQISLFGAGTTSTPLPGGATIQELESYTAAGPVAVAVVLGSDGRAYSNRFVSGAWSGWAPTALAGATHIAVSETGNGAVVSSSNRVAPVGGGAASPVLPGGATIQDVTTNVNASGVYGVAVTGSNGQAYTASYNSTTGTWTNWTAATSSLSGSIQHIAQSKSTGTNVFLGSSNRVSLFGAGPTTPPLPNGATIVDMEGTTVGGVPSIAVLGSDGRAYNSSFQNGAWTAWTASRTGQSNLEFISRSETGAVTLVAGNPLC
ncbi:hypothetical protein [Herbiconiux ginsengi]|uniref:Uncharacterized protein n=1 Tax=Herbiconiux ginsengi TaxID=381665 RepID=A0A1H3SNC6_9MICO|nr:hypothetical protein [Herbiconiux ginsengi]SDZ39593.1 hypothetical protein SAMN05216554_3533 [Herbiconiux ginsengi]